MSPVVADAAVRIGADLAPFNKDLKGAGKQAETLGQKMKRALSPKNLALGLGLGIGIQQITSFFGDAIGAASDLGETTSKVGVVFGEAADEVLAMGKTSAEALGMSENAALSAAGTYGNLFRAMGMTEEKSAEMSVALVGLAADLASFNNMDPTQVLDKLRAGLSGETEPLKSLGINLNQARIQAKAMELGLLDATGALDASAKAQATYALILEDTTLAQGDFARTSGGLANQQRMLEAKMADLTAEIGEQLLPVMVELVTFVNEDMIPALTTIPDVLADAAENFARLVDMPRGMTEQVERVMKALGLSYMDARSLILRANSEMGMSADEFAGKVEAGYNVLDVASTAATRNVKLRNKEIVVSNQETADAIPGILANVPSGIANPYEEGAADAVDALADIPEKAADEMLANQFHLTDATTELLNFMDQALTPAQEIFNAQMFLASEAAAAGIASGNPLVVAKTEEMIAESEAVLRRFNAFQPGFQVGTSFADGMNAAYGYVRDAAGNLAAATRNQIGINSEPEDPNSPLHGITKWGGNIGRELAYGMLGELGTATAASRALAAALAPAGLLGSVAPWPGSGASGGVSGGNTFEGGIHINAPTTPMTPRDIARELKRTGAFGNIK